MTANLLLLGRSFWDSLSHGGIAASGAPNGPFSEQIGENSAPPSSQTIAHFFFLTHSRGGGGVDKRNNIENFLSVKKCRVSSRGFWIIFVAF